LVHETYGETAGALELFEKVHAEYEIGSSEWLRLFASHPPTSDRLDYLRALQQALQSEATE